MKSKSKARKIQELLTKHLLDCGKIEIKLPDNVVVEIDITQEGKRGEEIVDNYCCVKTSREGNSTLLDTYNVGLEYVDDRRKMICLDTFTNNVGQNLRRLDVV